MNKYTEGMGERLRIVRRRSRMKQDELAASLDVSRQSVSGYETERLMPSNKVIEKMCDLYEINPWWLMYGVGGPKPGSRGDTFINDPVAPNFDGESALTEAQMSLIEYIKADGEAARNLAKMLWDRALKD